MSFLVETFTHSYFRTNVNEFLQTLWLYYKSSGKNSGSSLWKPDINNSSGDTCLCYFGIIYNNNLHQKWQYDIFINVEKKLINTYLLFCYNSNLYAPITDSRFFVRCAGDFYFQSMPSSFVQKQSETWIDFLLGTKNKQLWKKQTWTKLENENFFIDWR